MNNLKKQLRKQNRSNLTSFKKNLKESDNLSWWVKQYTTKRQRTKLTTPQLKKVILLNYKAGQKKQYLKDCEFLNFLADIREIPQSMSVSIEWKKNRTWGANPDATFLAYGLDLKQSGSISGCGYCKESTAFAKSINQSFYFLALLAKEKNRPKNYGKTNEQIFGYGVCGVIPKLSGGVGTSCYYSVFDAIGYKLDNVANGKMFNVYKAIKK